MNHQTEIDDAVAEHKLGLRTEPLTRETYEMLGAMPFRVALAKIAGTAAADYSIIAPLPAEHQVRILCRMIDDMREIADKALGTEQTKRELKDWREAHAKDESREGDA